MRCLQDYLIRYDIKINTLSNTAYDGVRPREMAFSGTPSNYHAANENKTVSKENKGVCLFSRIFRAVNSKVSIL